jgi:Na+/proline symporter
MEIFLIIIWIHFIADFVFQTDKMALNKSKSNKWLGIHSLIYCIPFIFFGWQYAVVNGIIHFVIDYMTARGTSKLWNANKRHWFFVLIGLDQAIHITILIITFKLFVI